MSRYNEKQIIGFIKLAEAGLPIKELCRKGGFSDATFYKWRASTQAWRCPMRDACVNLRRRTPSSRRCWRAPTWTFTH